MSMRRSISFLWFLPTPRWRGSLPLFILLFSAVFGWSQNEVAPQVSLPGSPEPIYSADPNDCWNRIFYFLFSRRMDDKESQQHTNKAHQT